MFGCFCGFRYANCCELLERDCPLIIDHSGALPLGISQRSRVTKDALRIRSCLSVS